MEYKVRYRKIKNKGRGVLALKSFKKGEIIERCPVIILSPKESAICETTVLDVYIYPWKSSKDGILPLGYGLLYNHSFEPNAQYTRSYVRREQIYTAIRPIKKGEEILVNYNGDPKSKVSVDLDPRGRK